MQKYRYTLVDEESIQRLFSEFWRGILGVVGTIQGKFREVSSGKLKGNKKEKRETVQEKYWKIPKQK